MNTRFGVVLIVMLLGWPLMGGCPVNVDADVEIDAAAAVDVSVDDDDASSTIPGNGGDDGAAGDDSSDDGDSSPDDGQDQDSGDSADDAGGDGDDSADDAGGDADGDEDDGDGDDEPAFAGTYTGELSCAKRESIDGGSSWLLERDWSTDFALTFAGDGIPTGLPVARRDQDSGSIDWIAQVGQIGDSVTLEETVNFGGGPYYRTVTVTVGLATYQGESGRIVLTLEYHGDAGVDENGDPISPNLTEDGTGAHVVEYGLENGQLVYSSVTTYDVALFNGAINQLWEVTCEGTLAPE